MLTPAYDICPQGPAGGEAAQVMAIGKDGWKFSRVEGCAERAGTYLLSADEARTIIDHQIRTIASEWESVCDAGGLTNVDRRLMYGRQFLNPSALEGYDGEAMAPVPR
ncbi:MAG: HipA domain-containing protein [Actinomycetota bacterium]|nr:HipA domain-containing protein [Actinomycetota bacterium]